MKNLATLTAGELGNAAKSLLREMQTSDGVTLTAAAAAEIRVLAAEMRRRTDGDYDCWLKAFELIEGFKN